MVSRDGVLEVVFIFASRILGVLLQEASYSLLAYAFC
jgi:hypothetical protein